MLMCFMSLKQNHFQFVFIAFSKSKQTKVQKSENVRNNSFFEIKVKANVPKIAKKTLQRHNQRKVTRLYIISFVRIYAAIDYVRSGVNIFIEK
jgi:hypothetical protein